MLLEDASNIVFGIYYSDSLRNAYEDFLNHPEYGKFNKVFFGEFLITVVYPSIIFAAAVSYIIIAGLNPLLDRFVDYLTEIIHGRTIPKPSATVTSMPSKKSKSNNDNNDSNNNIKNENKTKKKKNNANNLHTNDANTDAAGVGAGAAVSESKSEKKDKKKEKNSENDSFSSSTSKTENGGKGDEDDSTYYYDGNNQYMKLYAQSGDEMKIKGKGSKSSKGIASSPYFSASKKASTITKRK